jgi:hypothetical protein
MSNEYERLRKFLTNHTAVVGQRSAMSSCGLDGGSNLLGGGLLSSHLGLGGSLLVGALLGVFVGSLLGNFLGVGLLGSSAG